MPERVDSRAGDHVTSTAKQVVARAWSNAWPAQRSAPAPTGGGHKNRKFVHLFPASELGWHCKRLCNATRNRLRESCNAFAGISGAIGRVFA